MELLQEVVLVVLVLKRYKGMANKVGEVEQKAIVRGILIVKYDPTVIDEFDLLGYR